MLILQRRPGESLVIGEDIYIEILAVENGRVRLAIKAPAHVPILRTELRSAMDANRDAAKDEMPPQELLELLEGVWTEPSSGERP